MKEYAIPSKPSVPNENDNLGVLVNKVKEVDAYTDALRTELINIDNSIVDLNGDSSVSKLPLDATLTQVIEKSGEVGTNFANSLNDVKNELKESVNTPYSTVNGVKEFTCKSGYVDNIAIQGQTKILDANNVEVAPGTSGAKLASVGQGDKIEVLTYDSLPSTTTFSDYIVGHVNIDTGMFFTDSPTARTVIIPCKPNTVYDVKKLSVSARTRIGIYSHYPSSGSVALKVIGVDSNINNILCNTPTNGNYIAFNTSNNSETPIVEVKEYRTDKKQISTTLRSLPNGIKDEVVQQGDRYYKIVRCGEVVLNGQQEHGNFFFNGSNTLCHASGIKINGVKLVSSGNVYCDKYNGIQVSQAGDNPCCYTYKGGQGHTIYLQVLKSKYQTLQTLLDDLKVNPITVVYELETPQIIEIPNPNPRVFGGATTNVNEFWVTDFIHVSSTWQIKAKLNYSNLPFSILNPSDKVIIVEVNDKSGSWVRNIILNPGVSTQVNISENEVIGYMCFKSSSGWKELSDLPYIKTLFANSKYNTTYDKTTFLLNTGVVQGEASFEVTNSLGSALDVMADKVSSLDEFISDKDVYTPTLLNGWKNRYEGVLPIRVVKNGGIVTIDGSLLQGVISASTLIFTVPQKFRPKTNIFVPVFERHYNKMLGYICINSEGKVIIQDGTFIESLTQGFALSISYTIV